MKIESVRRFLKKVIIFNHTLKRISDSTLQLYFDDPNLKYVEINKKDVIRNLKEKYKNINMVYPAVRCQTKINQFKSGENLIIIEGKEGQREYFIILLKDVLKLCDNIMLYDNILVDYITGENCEFKPSNLDIIKTKLKEMSQNNLLSLYILNEINKVEIKDNDPEIYGKTCIIIKNVQNIMKNKELIKMTNSIFKE